MGSCWDEGFLTPEGSLTEAQTLHVAALRATTAKGEKDVGTSKRVQQ